MNQEYFWIVSLSFSALALTISSITAYSSLKRERKTADYSLLEKKTDLLITLSELRDRTFELEQIMVSKANLIITSNTGQKIHDIEQSRLEGNIDLSREKRKEFADSWKNLEQLKPTDVESFESMKVTYNCWLNNTLQNIKSESKSFEDFRESIKNS